MTSLGRRTVLILAAALATVLAVPAGARATGDLGREAGQFIESLESEAIKALTGKDVGQEERMQNFRDLFNAYFDVPFIGRFVLSHHWRRASDEQRDTYMRLFEDYIVATYAHRFKDYSGESLEVRNVVIDEDGDTALVESHIVRPQGEPIRVDWRVREEGGTKKIIDVVVEGVSMSQTQRSEFSSVIKRSGGIDGLIEALRKKTETLPGAS